MFEQRVLQAYREKVAAERQQKLLEELAEENDIEKAKEAKKAKEAQKRKEKKDKQRQQKAEEKAKKDAEKAAKEAEIKAAEEKRVEEQRLKREEQRKRKELERKGLEEEKQRKDAERLKRQQEERERQQELERKAREQKAQEKKIKEDAKRKEREEREAREKEAREKKAHDDKERRERDARIKAEKERLRKEEQPATAGHSATPPSKKATQQVAPALPPQLLKQNSSTGFPSRHAGRSQSAHSEPTSPDVTTRIPRLITKGLACRCRQQVHVSSVSTSGPRSTQVYFDEAIVYATLYANEPRSTSIANATYRPASRDATASWYEYGYGHATRS
jgi:hypothetical protein